MNEGADDVQSVFWLLCYSALCRGKFICENFHSVVDEPMFYRVVWRLSRVFFFVRIS